MRYLLSPLTDGKFGIKESARLRVQNRRMFDGMQTTLQSACESLQLILVVTLLAACVANLAIVWVWL
jgi:hypothetical protein